MNLESFLRRNDFGAQERADREVVDGEAADFETEFIPEHRQAFGGTDADFATMRMLLGIGSLALDRSPAAQQLDDDDRADALALERSLLVLGDEVCAWER